MTGINIAFGLGSGLFLLRSVLEDIASKNAYKKSGRQLTVSRFIK